MKRRSILAIGVALLALATAGCASDEDGVTRVIFAAGNDPSGATETLVREFNEAHPGIEVTFQVMPANTDTQHDAYVTYLSASDPGIDLYSMDVIWTAEFAKAGWIQPIPDDVLDRDEFLDAPLASATYDGRLYAAPWFTDAGVLYYRSDLLDQAGHDVPETWPELRDACAAIAGVAETDGFLWQGARYEGLVCNFLEALWGLGGSLDPEDLAERPDEVEDGVRRTLEHMASLIDDPSISPRSVLTYKEEDARRLFTEGRALFLRNWPYAWSFAQGEESKVRGAVGIARLPHAPGETSYSTIGGWNIGLSSYSRHPDESLEFLRFITNERSMKLRAIQGGYLPTLRTTYADEEVLEANPHYADFFEVFKNARNRPKSPNYPRVSDIIQENAHGALSGEIDHGDAAAAIVEGLAAILVE